MSPLPSDHSGHTTDYETPLAHLETTIQVRHLLGVLPLGDADTLLHLLGLGLDIFPKRNEPVNCGLERVDKWLGIKCYVRDIRVSWRGASVKGSYYIRPVSALD